MARFLGLLVLLLFYGVPSQADAGVQNLGKVGWWTIAHRAANPDECYAYATYEGGVTFYMGISGVDKQWFFSFYDPDWSSIRPAQSYSIKYVFSGRRSWIGPAIGYTNGLKASGLKESFVKDIARSNNLAIYYQDSRIGRYSLKGTSKAIAAVERCYRQRIQSPDPFKSKADPFAAKGAGALSAPSAPAGGFGTAAVFKATCPQGVANCSPQNQCLQCDMSCEYCQNLDHSRCGPNDCMTCLGGKRLIPLYDDGSGRCD